MMQNGFDMSMMGELHYFLGLHIYKLKQGTFINQAKYCKKLLKMFDMEKSKAIDTPMGLQAIWTKMKEESQLKKENIEV